MVAAVSSARRRARERATELLVVPGEIALAGVTLAAVIGLSRLFEGASFLAPLVALAVAGHLAAAACRRAGLSGAAVAGVAVVVGGLLFTWILLPSTTWAGLPTLETVDFALADLRSAYRRFGHAVAPAPVEDGFVLACAVAVWLVVWFSDWAAFRLGAMIEATLPAGALFLLGGLLGAPGHRVSTTLLFAAAVCTFVLLHRTNRQARSAAWVGGGDGSGTRALLATGGGLALIAACTGALVGPAFPGARDDALVDWRNRGDGDGTRVTVSPLVDIRKRLVEQSDAEVFRVRSTARAYWRLTSLETFDGTVWSSGGSFAEADGDLPGRSTLGKSRLVVQEFDVTNLAAIWAPAAFHPASVDRGEAPLRWDRDSATLIVDSDLESSNGISYEVVSEVPDLTRVDLERPDVPLPDDLDKELTDLPPGFPAEIRSLAAEITASASIPYGKALLLQDWFRDNFTYDLASVPAGHGENAIRAFLDSRRGYCEQFAGTYAAMARSLGIPSRVAVGFTPGAAAPSDPDLYRVRGKNAHAWPEVYIAPVGWVAFEPTPGRGQPGAEAYTGVPEEQAGEAPGPTVTTAPTTAPTAAPGAAPTTVGQGRLEANATTGPVQPRDRADGPAWPLWVLTGLGVAFLAFVVYAGLLGVTRWGWRRHRRSRARSAVDRIQVAWLEGTESAATLGPALRASETHTEFAERAGPDLGDAAPPLTSLAELATVAAWSGSDPPPDEADEASRLSSDVGEQVRQQLDRRQRVRTALDPRPLLRR